jgi:hypothetical protein
VDQAAMAVRAERLSFVAQLSTANQSRRGWEVGWSIVGREGEDWILERDGFRLYASSDDICPAPGESSSVAAYSVDVGKEFFNLLGGWYVVLSEAVDPNPENLVRIYFNIGPSDAVKLVQHCTTRLNAGLVPFRLKVPDDPRAYNRVDTAVLYVRKSHYEVAISAIADLCRSLNVMEGVPAFAKKLAPGIAVAEDPGGGLSFGQHRSRLIAQGLWRAFMEGATGTQQKMLHVEEEFRREQLDCRSPHLGPDSVDIYESMRHD